ncbi:hypothetical protein [Marinoscillum sp.]|uniref:hypothetical protein n=1 Tax=Marinoscillum sp. TaxID=2024838 RepID=UPI003BAA26FD
MESQPSSGPFQVIRVIHLGLMAGPMLLGIISYLLILQPKEGVLYDDTNILTFIPIVALMISVPGALIVFKSQINGQLKENPPTERKLAIYQTAHIIRMALMEFAALFGVVVCIVTVSYINYFTTGVALLIMLLMLPTKFRISEDLKLNRDEQKQLFG